jgi:hypothetical protein
LLLLLLLLLLLCMCSEWLVFEGISVDESGRQQTHFFVDTPPLDVAAPPGAFHVQSGWCIRASPFIRKADRDTFLCAAYHFHLLLLLLLLPVLLPEWLVFEGISVDESGRQHYLDATVAYKRAVLNAIHYLAKFGYTPEQVRQ